jgi:hypothetical protein
MFDSPTTLPQDDVSPVAEVATRPATLITEQQVMFSTAVALSASKSRRMVRKERRHKASRHSFLDASLMQREMHRL